MPRVKIPIQAPAHQNLADEMGLDKFGATLIDGFMDEAGNINRRPGLVAFTTTGETVGAVDGLFWWEEGNCVIAVQNGKIFKITSAPAVEDITPAGANMQVGTRVIFTKDAKRVFMVNGGKIFWYDGGASHVIGTDGNLYTCTSAHTSGATTHPTTGVDWATKWKLDGVAYTEPSRVIGTDTNKYVCILAHIAAADNTPTTGVNYATYWRQEGSEGDAWVVDTAYVVSDPPLWETATVYVITGDAVQMVDADAPPNVTFLAFIDQYLLGNYVGTSQVHYSELEIPMGWSALSVFAAESKPDNVTAIHVAWREILVLGPDSADLYWNDGVTPFSRVEGAFSEVGCIAPYSLKYFNNTWHWLSDKRNLVRINQRTPEIISTPFDRIIQAYSTVSDALADTCEVNGRAFYVLSFPTVGKTLVFDYMLSQWYEWAYYTGGAYERWLGNCICYAKGWNKWLVGSRLAGGKIYEMSATAYTDDTVTIRTLKRTGHISHNVMARKRSNGLFLKLKRGVGFGAGAASKVLGTDAATYTCILEHTSSANDKPITGGNWSMYWSKTGTGGGAWVVDTAYSANIPYMIVRWKNDNGSWGADHKINLGLSGDTDFLGRLRRLGVYRARQWEFILSDAVPLLLCDAEEDIVPSEGEEAE